MTFISWTRKIKLLPTPVLGTRCCDECLTVDFFQVWSMEPQTIMQKQKQKQKIVWKIQVCEYNWYINLFPLEKEILVKESIQEVLNIVHSILTLEFITEFYFITRILSTQILHSVMLTNHLQKTHKFYWTLQLFLCLMPNTEEITSTKASQWNG